MKQAKTGRMSRRAGHWTLFVVLSAAMVACSDNTPSAAMGLLEWDRVELIAETNEPILEIAVREGDTLEAGAIILHQDPRRIQAQLDEAKAGHAQADARLAELKRGPRAERISEARARLEGATSEAVNARKELERIQALLGKQLVSPESVDTARNRLTKAMADENASRAALDELLHGTTVEELQQAEAAVTQANARARALAVTLENLVLRAPRPGRLDSLPYKTGERPTAGAVVAVMLVNSVPYARVYVPEPVRARVHQGSRAMIYVDGVSAPFPGRVRMISSEAVFTPYYSLTERDRSRLSYVAEVEVAEPAKRELPSGVPVRVEFPGDQ